LGIGDGDWPNPQSPIPNPQKRMADNKYNKYMYYYNFDGNSKFYFIKNNK